MLFALPNLYVLGLFSNESISNSKNYGSRISVGFCNEDLYTFANFRFHYPETNTALHRQKKIHGDGSLLTGFLLNNLAYFSHGISNGTTSIVSAYVLKASTPFTYFPTHISAGIGVHGRYSWSKNYDGKLWDIDPHMSLAVTQGFFDRLYVHLFVTTDILCHRENNLSNWYGFAVALALTENLTVVVKPLVHLSDYTNESRFVSEREISFSACYTDATSRNHLMHQTGIWL
jgi:hypothetical protein